MTSRADYGRNREVMEQLMTALDDHEPTVRRAACAALPRCSARCSAPAGCGRGCARALPLSRCSPLPHPGAGWPRQIPDELVTYYLNRSGFNCPDQRVKRLIAVAAQKFISDIATEALSSARQRSQKRDRASRDRPAPAKADSKLVLTTEDLCALRPFRPRLRADNAVTHGAVDCRAIAAQRHGIAVKKPRFFSDSTAAIAK